MHFLIAKGVPGMITMKGLIYNVPSMCFDLLYGEYGNVLTPLGFRNYINSSSAELSPPLTHSPLAHSCREMLGTDAHTCKAGLRMTWAGQAWCDPLVRHQL